MVRAATAEAIGTFVLVFAGTAVAVGALLNRPIAGGAYDSLAIPLAFGLALVALVPPWVTYPGRTSTPP